MDMKSCKNCIHAAVCGIRINHTEELIKLFSLLEGQYGGSFGEGQKKYEPRVMSLLSTTCIYYKQVSNV